MQHRTGCREGISRGFPTANFATVVFGVHSIATKYFFFSLAIVKIMT